MQVTGSPPQSQGQPETRTVYGVPIEVWKCFHDTDHGGAVGGGALDPRTHLESATGPTESDEQLSAPGGLAEAAAAFWEVHLVRNGLPRALQLAPAAAPRVRGGPER